jgi:hypothetical protein
LRRPGEDRSMIPPSVTHRDNAVGTSCAQVEILPANV